MSRDLSQKIAELKIKTAEEDESGPYEIRRFYYGDKKSRRIKTVATKDEAMKHTGDPKTRKEGVYFDAFDQMYRNLKNPKKTAADETYEGYKKNERRLKKKYKGIPLSPYDKSAQIDCPQMKLDKLKESLKDI